MHLTNWFLPSYNSCDIFIDDIVWITNFIVTWPNSVIFLTSKSYLIWALLDQLSLLVFFISKNCIVRRNGRRMDYLLTVQVRTWVFHIHLMTTCHSHHFLIVSRYFMVGFKRYHIIGVLSWTWHQCFISQVSIIKPAFLASHVTCILNNLHTNWFYPILSQMFSLVSLFLYVFKTYSIIILPRSWYILFTKTCSTCLSISALKRRLGPSDSTHTSWSEICWRSYIFTISIDHCLEWLLTIK